MKQLGVVRTVVGAVSAVVVEAITWHGLHSLYRCVPDYHAFWSGAVLYTGVLSLIVVPALVTVVVLWRRTSFVGVAGALTVVGAFADVVVAVAVSSVVPVDLWVAYWSGLCLLTVGVFAGVKAQRDRDTSEPAHSNR